VPGHKAIRVFGEGFHRRVFYSFRARGERFL
jgi:hypothetical protein